MASAPVTGLVEAGFARHHRISKYWDRGYPVHAKNGGPHQRYRELPLRKAPPRQVQRLATIQLPTILKEVEFRFNTGDQDLCKILGPQLSVQDRRDPAAAIGRARCNERRDHRHHRRVLRFVIAPTRPGPALRSMRLERAMPGVSATTFTGNRPPAATARARSVFLSVTCPQPRAGFRPPASCGRAAAQARERGPPAAEQRDGDVIIPGHGNAPPLQA